MRPELERSQPLNAYADTFGEPDLATTSRMRKRIKDFMRDREAKRQRAVHWTQAALVTAVIMLLVGAGLWWQSADEAPPEPGASAVFATGDHPQELELEHTGRVLVAAESRVRVVQDDQTGLELEIESGEVVVRLPDLDSRIYLVRVGAYHVEAESKHFGVRRTAGMPLVTVHSGRVLVFGPDLPQTGIRIVAPE